MDVEEAAAPSNSQMFKALNVKELPRVTGVMWLRFTLAPLPAGGRSQAMPDTPEIFLEEPASAVPAPSDDAQIEKEAAPVEEQTAPQQAEPLDILPDAAQLEPLSMQADAELQPEAQPEIIAEILPEPSTEEPQKADAATPQQDAPQAANNTDAEFMASAGLEGPQWAAEASATQASEPEPEPARESEAEDAAAQQENPASAPVEQAELLTDTPVATPVSEVTEQMSAPADKTPVALETLEWPEPEQHPASAPAARETVTPAEFLEASLPSDPDMPEPAEQPAEQPAAESVAPLKAMNIADDNIAAGKSKYVQDMHFQCEGPIVDQLRRAFLLNWGFCTNNYTPLPPATTLPRGESRCRIIMPPLQKVLADPPVLIALNLNGPVVEKIRHDLAALQRVAVGLVQQ